MLRLQTRELCLWFVTAWADIPAERWPARRCVIPSQPIGNSIPTLMTRRRKSLMQSVAMSSTSKAMSNNEPLITLSPVPSVYPISIKLSSPVIQRTQCRMSGSWNFIWLTASSFAWTDCIMPLTIRRCFIPCNVPWMWSKWWRSIRLYVMKKQKITIQQ